MKDVKWTAHIELLSPLHIGTGTDLLEGVDWIHHEGHVYVANQEAVLEAVFDRGGTRGQEDAAIARIVAGMTLSDLVDAGYLTGEDFRPDSPLFRYRLPGTPAMNQIAEQIKDVYGRPYLPGSSLKGAWRTVLAVGGATLHKLRFDRLGRSRSWAAQPVERALLGRNPNYDLLRALQVSDSGPVSPDLVSLMQVNIYPTARPEGFSKPFGSGQGRQRGLDVDVEALRPGTTFQVPIKVEGFLFSDQAERELQFGQRRGWLLNLAQWARVAAGRRIAEEMAFFQQRADGRAALGFYSRLAQAREGLGKDECLLQVGWGGGWLSKTFGRLLQEDAVAFEGLVREYRMTKERGRRPGDPFPRSRHLVREQGQPAVPLGWLKVRLERTG